MNRRRIVHEDSTSGEATSLPCNLVALESDDGSFAMFSFSLPSDAARSRLTPAEADVVCLVVAGRTNRCIAALRGTTPRTVANQVASIFRKLGVSSRLELAVKAPLMCVPE